jgi:hypothetical protein
MTTKKTNGSPHTALQARFANLYGTFGSDPELEQKGITLDYALENGKRVEFTIKRAGARNAAWKKAYREHVQAIEGSGRELSEQESAELLAGVYADTIVLGWNGVEDVDGKPVPFTKKDCRELLVFLPELLQLIVNDSHNRANFRRDELDAQRKN